MPYERHLVPSNYFLIIVIAAFIYRITSTIYSVIAHNVFFLFVYTGHLNGESQTLCLMKCMAMELCHTKVLSTLLEENLRASKHDTRWCNSQLYILILLYDTSGVCLNAVIDNPHSIPVQYKIYNVWWCRHFARGILIFSFWYMSSPKTFDPTIPIMQLHFSFDLPCLLNTCFFKTTHSC